MRENKSITKRLAAFAAAAAMAAMTGCAAPGPQPLPEEQAVQAIEVHTTTAGYGTIDRQTQFVGRVEAAESVKVYATTQAKVVETHFAPGERVEKGQLLFALDTENLETMVETARLQYESALSGADTTIIQSKSAYDAAGDRYISAREARDNLEDSRDSAANAVNRAKTSYDAAQKSVESATQQVTDAQQKVTEAGEDAAALAEAKAALEKAQEALTKAQSQAAEAAQGYATAQTAYEQVNNSYIQNYDALKDQVDSARKSLAIARDTYNNTKGDEEAGITGTVQSQVDLAKISYDNAVKNLNDARVYAPVSGIVSAKNIAVSDMAAPGAPLYIIEPEGGAPMVSFNLSEDGANALSVGSPVTVIYDGKEYSAQITELSNTANPQTGLYAAKAQTDEPLSTTRSGGVVKVQASTAKAEDALLLSLDLLEYDGNQPYVYVYRDGTAVRVDVTTGISSAEEVVILSGITADDQIITTWHPDLKDGAAVALMAETTEQAEQPQPEQPVQP